MNGSLVWLAAGFIALVVVAFFVACFEQLRQLGRPRRSWPDPPCTPPPAAPDLDLELLPPGGAAAASRREALDGALLRMAQPGESAEAATARRWTDTRPMIGPAAPKLAPSEQA